MIGLVIWACALASPLQCKEFHVGLADVSVTQCTAGAQPFIADWAADHPDYRVMGWKCLEAGESAPA